jgi:sugar (pentulose or hexulose) kinase
VVDLLAPPQPVKADRALISRAVMEGAARALNAKLQLLKAQGLSFERAVLIGGPGRSPVWPGIIADITGLELVVGSPHAGATGAAMLAATGAGISSGARAPSDPTDPFPKKGVS